MIRIEADCGISSLERFVGGRNNNVARALSSDSEARRQNEAERKVRREGRGTVLSVVAILTLQDFVHLMFHHLINLRVILKHFAMLR